MSNAANLVIKPLEPALAADFFDFFEHRAFTDDSPYRCYCEVYQMSRAQFDAAFRGVSGADTGRAAREQAQKQIAAGEMRGYLAYIDGVCIGWCNAGDRSHYPEDCMNGAHLYAPAQAREKAVVCFEIAPECRGRGVATALLDAVIADAVAEGCAAVVSFPAVRSERFEWDFNGPVRLYEKAGFVKVADGVGFIVMRKSL